MSRRKREGKAHYEMLFIVPNKFTEEEAKKIIEKVKTIIKEEGGEVTYDEYWGKKKMMYEIEHYNHGYYALYEFNLEGESLAAVDKKIRMSRDILRHQIVVKELRSVEEIEEEKKKADEIVAKGIKKEKEKEEKEEVKKEEVKKKEEDKKTKVELKDLDDKLDKILDTDDLL